MPHALVYSPLQLAAVWEGQWYLMTGSRLLAGWGRRGERRGEERGEEREPSLTQPVCLTQVVVVQGYTAPPVRYNYRTAAVCCRVIGAGGRRRQQLADDNATTVGRVFLLAAGRGASTAAVTQGVSTAPRRWGDGDQRV